MLSIDIPEEMNRAVAHPFDLVRMPQSLDDLDFGTNRQDIDFEGVLTLKDFPDLGTSIYQKQLETYNTRLLYIICNLKNTTLYHRGEIPPRGDPLGEHAFSLCIRWRYARVMVQTTSLRRVPSLIQ